VRSVKVKVLYNYRRVCFHVGLLAVFCLLGAFFRFWNLEVKPLWTDEFATIAFSLGNGFKEIPLSQTLTADTLLAPLRLDSTVMASNVSQRLLTESNHPPLYFLLSHVWFRLFTSNGAYVSEWVARSLPALIGVLTIPASFGLAWVAFRSLTVAHLSAALMAVSPFGVYLAQEARHYTLPILWILASLTCLVAALQYLYQRRSLPLWLTFLWVGINGLGMATHYFFGLTLFAEGVALLIVWFWQMRLPDESIKLLRVSTQRLTFVAMGTLAGGAVWIPFWRKGYNTELTRWVFQPQETVGRLIAACQPPPALLPALINDFFEPFGNLLAVIATVFTLLPVQEVPRLIRVPAAIAMFAFTIWLFVVVTRRLLAQRLIHYRWMVMTFVGFLLGAIASLLLIEYAIGANLTRGLRYGFFYFPALIVLAAAGLALLNPAQSNSAPFRQRRNAFIAFTLVMAVTGSALVSVNLGYQKVHRPDVVVQMMQKWSENPPLIAILHRTHGQTGRLMGLAWEFRKQPDQGQAVRYYLDNQNCKQTSCRLPSEALQEEIATNQTPTDLWLVNYRNMNTPIEIPGCQWVNLTPENRCPKPLSIDGYEYQLYRCQGKTAITNGLDVTNPFN